MYIYLDESGNLTKSDTKYFIVGSFSVANPSKVANAFRRWQKSKLPNILKRHSEVKFSDLQLDDELRLKTLQFLVKQELDIYYTYLKTSNIPEWFRDKKRGIKTSLLYAQIVAETLKQYIPFKESEIYIFRDQRMLKGMSTSMFNKQISLPIHMAMGTKTAIQIQALDSTSSPGIQIADWICGAIARYHEQKPRGKEFREILKKNIVKYQELFPDYWMKKWKK